MTAEPTGSLAVDPTLNSVLGKANALLRAFQDGHLTLRLTDLAQRSGVSKASVYRLAEQLVDLGMLARTEDGYQLGIAMFEFGRHVPLPASLSATARPILVDLATAIRATVHLSVMDDLDVLYVEKINGRQGFHLISSVGARMPLSTTASGRVLLASSRAREAAIDRLMTLGMLDAAALPGLRRELTRVDELGYAVERDVVARGWKSIAVGVRDGVGETTAALSAVVQSSRTDEHEIVRHVRAAAGSISRRTRSVAASTSRSPHHARSALVAVAAGAPGCAPSAHHCRR
ncbi:IclR family transcriptional regulator [Nocardioides sp. AN3]